MRFNHRLYPNSVKDHAQRNRIAWVSVNYNSDTYIREWVQSISELEGEGKHSIYIVDNSSDLIKPTTINEITVFDPKTNLGYFGGFNYCLERIDIGRYDYFVLSNPDILFQNDFYQRLSKLHYIPPDTFVIAPRITSTQGEQNPNVDKRITPVRRICYDIYFSHYIIGSLMQKIFSIITNKQKSKRHDIANPRTIYMPHGACFILTPNFFKNISRLDDRVFLWGEEALLRSQVVEQGGKIWFEPSLRTFHKEHSILANIPSRKKYDIWKRSFKIYRNHL